MDTLAPSRPPMPGMPEDAPGLRGDHAVDCQSAHAGHHFLTHDQRSGDTRELGFDDLDPRERSIFLRCGFHAPSAACTA